MTFKKFYLMGNLANDDMYIIWIIWELFVFHSVSGKLHLSNTYLNWKNSINGCGSTTIATLQNTPLDSSEWSSIELDSMGAWLGSYYIVTPFYWTRGECFQFNSSAVRDGQRKVFRNITAEKCAFFCATQIFYVKYMALQDTNCFCLDKRPHNSLPNGCKTNCTNVLNERCGSVQGNSVFAYKRLEGNQENGIRRLNTKDLLANCFTIFVNGSWDKREVYFDLEKCSTKRGFICRREKPEAVSSIISPQKSFYDSSVFCMRRNMTQAYITPSDTTTDQSLLDTLLVGYNYWIGLRRFSTFVSIEDSNIPLVTPRTCIAITKERKEIVTRLLDCSIELRYVCQKKHINVGTTASYSETTVNNTITNIEDLTTEHISSSLTTGTIIGVAVFLFIIVILVF